MPKELISIVGINRKIVHILTSAGYPTIEAFREATRRQADRKTLAKKTGLPLSSIAYWAAQADLLRLESMTYSWACDLIETGIYSVDQLKNANSLRVLDELYDEKSDTGLSDDDVERLKKECDNVLDEGIFEAETIEQEMSQSSLPSIYTDLSTVIAELGKGVAQAQHALDLNSVELQNKILDDDKLYGMGLQATWYVMPEVEFTMKMDYAVCEEESRNIQGNIQIGVAPSNATYSNLFKTSKKEESTIKLRIVPIPANDKFAVRKYMPDFSACKSVKEIKEILEENDISVYEIIHPEEENEWDDLAQIKVVRQEPSKNAIMKINDVPKIKIEK